MTGDSNLKFRRFAVFGLLYVSLGRPQDVWPVLKAVHPGLFFGGLVLVALYLAGREARWPVASLFREKKWFVALWVMMLVSTLSSIYLRASVEFIIEYAKTVVLLFGLLCVLQTERDFFRMACVFLAAVVTLCAPIVLSGIDTERISIGTFYDPNDMAMFASCAIPFLLYLAQARGVKLKLIALASVALAIATVIATQSRMGFLALVINALFYLFYTRPESIGMLRKMLLLGGAAVVFALFAGSFYWARIETTFESGQTGSGRTLVWERGLKIVAEYPLLGAGPGTFISAYGRMLKDGRFGTVGNEYDRAWKAAHNSYLVVAAELGVAGFVFFVMIIRICLTELLRVRRESSSTDGEKNLRILASVTISSLGVFLFCSMFLSQAYSTLFMTLVACSLLVRRIHLRRGESLSDVLEVPS